MNFCAPSKSSGGEAPLQTVAYTVMMRFKTYSTWSATSSQVSRCILLCLSSLALGCTTNTTEIRFPGLFDCFYTYIYFKRWYLILKNVLYYHFSKLSYPFLRQTVKRGLYIVLAFIVVDLFGIKDIQVSHVSPASCFLERIVAVPNISFYSVC